MYWLIVVTFLSGGTLGPVVETTQMPSQEACEAVRLSTADAIVAGAQGNVTSAWSVVEQLDEVRVVSSINGATIRNVAVLKCQAARVRSGSK